MSRLIITNKGEELVNKNEEVVFTRLIVSDDIINISDSNIKNIIEFNNIVNEVGISAIVKSSDSVVEIFAVENNRYTEKEYFSKTVGIMAQGTDEVEILFGICLDYQNFMYKFNNRNATGATYHLIIEVDNSLLYSAVLDDDGIISYKYIEVIEAESEKHINSSFLSETGIHGLRYYNGLFYVFVDDKWILCES